MLRSGRTLAAVGCGLMLMSACSQPTRPQPPPSSEAQEDGFRGLVQALASDDFQGRKPGTAGEEKTVQYLVAQFRRLKLKPGNGDSFLQSVPMVELTPSAAPTLSIAGHAGRYTLDSGRDMVLWTKRMQPEAALEHSELVFAGYGIVAPEYSWNDYANVDVHGKTVIALVGDPGAAAADTTLFKGRTLTYYGTWTYKIEEAARQGASGVLLIHDAPTAPYGWDAVVASFAGGRLELAAADGNAGRPAVEGWLAADAAKSVFARAGLDLASLRAAAAKPGFKAVPMGVSADARLQTAMRRFNSSNVIAILPAQKRRHDYIVYSAHWDHLGPGYPGAVDNASGVAGLLMLAQSFSRARQQPDRSIVFMALTGGEDGQLGSRYYVGNPIFPLAQTVADINLDMLHIGGPTRDVTIYGIGQSDLETYLRDAAEIQGREVHGDPIPERGEFFRSDQFSFAKAGVPALYAVGGIDDSAHGPAWGRRQLEDYLEHRYRQSGDVYSPDWDVRGTVEDMALYLNLGMRLSQTRKFPNWHRGSEFRAARDASRETATD